MSLVTFSLGLLVLASTSFALGIRGRRIDSARICRPCGFDLQGLEENCQTCPECGANLFADRAVRIGHRRRSKGPIVAGAVLVIVAMGTAAPLLPYFGSPAWTARKPVWLLHRDLLAAHARLEAATELLSRFSGGRVSNEELADAARISLEIQASENEIWDPILGDLIETAVHADLLNPDEISQYIAQGVRVQVSLHERASQNDRIEVQLQSFVHRGSHNAGLAFSVRECTFVMDDPALTAALNAKREVWQSYKANTYTLLPQSVSRNVPIGLVRIGEQRGKARILVDVRARSRERVIGGPISYESGLFTNILAANQKLVELYRDPADKVQVEQAIRLVEFNARVNSDGSIAFEHQLEIKNLKLPVIGRLRMRLCEQMDGLATEFALVEVRHEPTELLYSANTSKVIITGEDAKRLPAVVCVEVWIEPDAKMAEEMQVWRLLDERIELGRVEVRNPLK
jgi:hypothetical protein